jgi:hypothetical protein
MILRFGTGDYEGDTFTTSSAGFRYVPATEHEQTHRIFVRVDFGGLVTDAFVDTGAPYSLCTPTLANQIGFDQSAAISVTKYEVRGEKIDGRLYRHPIKLIPDSNCGEAVELEITLFVPDERYSEHWVLPPFLGTMGGLDRIRFAFDMQTETFYFGPHE